MTPPPSTRRHTPDIAMLARLASGEQTVCVTLTGQSGVGKSKMARELVASLRSAKSEVLLVDDVEPAEARTLVESAFGSTPLVIATSILPLGIGPERPWPVRPLSLSSASELTQVTSESMRALTAQLGVTVEDLSVRDRQVLAWACQEVGGLPLGIELTAQMVGSLGMAWLARAALAGELVEALVRAPTDAVSRHPSLRAALDRTLAAVGPEARRLVAAVSHLRTGFGIGTAERIGRRLGLTTGSRALATLVDVGLLQRTSDPERLAVLAPARARPSATGGTADLVVVDDVLERLVRSALREIYGPCSRSARDRLHRESPNLRAALVRSTMPPDGTEKRATTRAAVLLAGLATSLCAADDDLEMAADELWHRAAELPAAAVALLAYASVELAAAPREAPRTGADKLADRIREGIAAARTCGDPELLLLLLAQPVRRMPYIQDAALAAASALEGVEVARSLRSAAWLCRFEAWKAMTLHMLGAHEEAEPLCLEALACARRTGDDGGVVIAAIALLWPFRPPSRLPPSLPSGRELVEFASVSSDHQAQLILIGLLAWREFRQSGGAATLPWCRDWVSLEFRLGPSPMILVLFWLLALIAAEGGQWSRTAYLLWDLPDRLPTTAGLLPSAAALVCDVRLRAVQAIGQREVDRLAAQARADGLWGRLAVAQDCCQDTPVARSATHATWRDRLTRRECEVAELIASGMTNKEIAHLLTVSAKTVMHHSSAIYRKLGVRDRTQATAMIVGAAYPQSAGTQPSHHPKAHREARQPR